MFYDYMSTPIGMLAISATGESITAIQFVDAVVESKPSDLTQLAKQSLSGYFAGTNDTFDLPLNYNQGTDFQVRTWQALTEIPYGISRSYADIAKAIKRPKSVRAVGAANGKNPFTIVVPCHRVIGSNKDITGYAGGIERKAWLLQHEGIEYRLPKLQNC